MVADKNLNKRKSLNSETPNKSPVKKLKSTEITPKQVQSPRLKSQKNSPARSPKLTALSKPAQAKNAKKTSAKRKNQPKVDEDDEEIEDGSVDGDDGSIEGGEDADSIEEEEIDAIEGEGDESVEAEDDDSVEGEDDINVDTDTDEDEDIEKKSPAPATVKSSKIEKAGNPKFEVFVGNVDYKKTEEDVKNFFKQAGKVSSVRLISFRSNVSRGYGFVTFKTEAGYKNALALNHTNFGGRQINVECATSKPSNKRQEKVQKGPQKKSRKTPVKSTNGK